MNLCCLLNTHTPTAIHTVFSWILSTGFCTHNHTLRDLKINPNGDDDDPVGRGEAREIAKSSLLLLLLLLHCLTRSYCCCCSRIIAAVQVRWWWAIEETLGHLLTCVQSEGSDCNWGLVGWLVTHNRIENWGCVTSPAECLDPFGSASGNDSNWNEKFSWKAQGKAQEN